MKNMIGPPVEGSDFFGREKEIKEAWGDLQDGNHLLIVAPRRIGKSSLVKRLLKEANQANWNTAYFDVQDIRSEFEFYKSFAKILEEESKTWLNTVSEKFFTKLGDIFNRIQVETEMEGIKVKFSLSPSQVKEIKDHIDSLLAQCGEILIAIDELPFFLARLEQEEDGKVRVSDFLHWLRAFRQKSKSQICWIFCGSIGLDTFTERLNLTESLNDILPFTIGAFDDPTAILFLKKLGQDNGLNITDGTANKIIEVIGWPIPYFLQVHFKQLKRLKANQNENSPITTTDIEKAYKNIIRDISALKTWEERLDQQLDPVKATHCKILLKSLCQNHRGQTRKKLFDILYPEFQDTKKCEDTLASLLALLERDGYIIVQERKYAFRSPLLRDFWFKMKVN